MTTSNFTSSDAIMISDEYHLRRYESKDVDSILDLFQANLKEEWSKYHDAKYLPNAMKYVEDTCSEKGDIRNIQKVYFETGGYFWVLVSSKDNDDKVYGTIGLEKLSDTECELRRMCLRVELRRQGYGSQMFSTLKTKAINEMGFTKIVCSTPEHGEDVIQFYCKKCGFIDTGKRQPIHSTPIQEVFLEWNK